MNTESLKKAFSYPFEDDEWLLKLGVYLMFTIGGFLFIPSLFAAGYAYEIRRRIIVNREEPSLPDWKNWDTLLLNGLKMMLVSIIAMLPGMVFWFGAYLMPILVFPLSASMEQGGELISILPLPLMWIGIAISMLLILLGSIYMMVATDHMIAEDRLGAVFNFRELWCVFRHNVMGYILSLLVLIGLYMILTVVAQILMMTCVLCCLAFPLMFIAGAYMVMISSALYAQVYVDGADKCAESSSTEIVNVSADANPFDEPLDSPTALDETDLDDENEG